MADAGRELALQVQVTIETTGRMLMGSEIGAALTTLDALRPDVIGLNCATGPAEMGEHLRYLSAHSRLPLSCLPNAGLPSVVEGKMHYDLTPDAACRAPQALRDRAWHQHRRRLLRYHPGAPESGRRRPWRLRRRRGANPIGNRAALRSTPTSPTTRRLLC